MRRSYIIGFVCVAVLSMGAVFKVADVQFFALSTPKVAWQDCGNLTGSQSALTATDSNSVGEITDANSIVMDIPGNWNEVNLRWETTANADATTVNVYGIAHDNMKQASSGATAVYDHYGLIGTLTLVGGTMAATESNVFVDTATVTDANGIMGMTVYDSGNNRWCVVKFDCDGYGRLVTIATTLEGSSTLHQHGRGN